MYSFRLKIPIVDIAGSFQLHTYNSSVKIRPLKIIKNSFHSYSKMSSTTFYFCEDYHVIARENIATLAITLNCICLCLSKTLIVPYLLLYYYFLLFPGLKQNWILENFVKKEQIYWIHNASILQIFPVNYLFQLQY